MRIKKIFQKIFKLFFQKLFILIYGKVLFEKNPNFINKSSIIKLNKVIIDNYDYNCFEIKEGRIYTDLVENVAVISNNILIPKVCVQKINGELKNEIDNVCLKKGTPRIKIKKKENC